jgi:chromosomal replication initiation ATPase DnaA
MTLRRKGEAEAYDERILGDGDFVQTILKEADQKLVRQIKARRKTGSLAKIIKDRCRQTGINETELRAGSQRRSVSKLRQEICFYLSRELGIPMAEIARQVGVGTSGVAMAIKGMEKVDL